MKGVNIIGLPEVDLGPLLQQVADHLHMTRTRSGNERCHFLIIKIQQPPGLLHEAPHLREVAAISRVDNGHAVVHLGDLEGTVMRLML
jgi:hypothetical protein